MSIPAPLNLQALQSEAARLALRPIFSALEPGLWSHGDREGKARACHLYRDGALLASGFGAGDAEALAQALERYLRRVARQERELAAARRRGVVPCPDCFDRHPEDRGCEDCDRGEVDEICCAHCDEPAEAALIACQCGDPCFALCTRCETPGRHLAQCPSAATTQEAAA